MMRRRRGRARHLRDGLHRCGGRRRGPCRDFRDRWRRRDRFGRGARTHRGRNDGDDRRSLICRRRAGGAGTAHRWRGARGRLGGRRRGGRGAGLVPGSRHDGRSQGSVPGKGPGQRQPEGGDHCGGQKHERQQHPAAAFGSGAIDRLCLVGDSIGGWAGYHNDCLDYDPNASFRYIFTNVPLPNVDNRITFLGFQRTSTDAGVTDGPERWDNNFVLLYAPTVGNKCRFKDAADKFVFSQ